MKTQQLSAGAQQGNMLPHLQRVGRLEGRPGDRGLEVHRWHLVHLDYSPGKHPRLRRSCPAQKITSTGCCPGPSVLWMCGL